jgi:hypothetical protein
MPSICGDRNLRKDACTCVAKTPVSMILRTRDLIITLCLLPAIVIAEGFCSGSLFGFPCCTKIVSNPEYDRNGYPYGTENGQSCVRLKSFLIRRLCPKPVLIASGVRMKSLMASVRTRCMDSHVVKKL